MASLTEDADNRHPFWYCCYTTADGRLLKKSTKIRIEEAVRRADGLLRLGRIEGSGNMRHAQTMAFTTLILFQLFNAFNARSNERSAFRGLFQNRWLWGAVGLSLDLQVAVIYVPFLQNAFSTTRLSLSDWLRCVAVASSVLWLRELSKFITRGRLRP